MARAEKPDQPFADFEARVVVIMIEYVALLFLTAPVQGYVLELLGEMAPAGRYVSLVLAMLYYTLSWASPMRATPIQFLFQMRVVDLKGERLSVAMAALRSLLLVPPGDPPALPGRQPQFDSSRNLIVTPKREPASRTLRRNHETSREFKSQSLGV